MGSITHIGETLRGQGTSLYRLFATPTLLGGNVTKNLHDSRLLNLLWSGIGVAVVGGIIAGSTIPGTDTQFNVYTETTETVSTGDATGFAIGLAILAIANCFLLVALIGYGVKYGIRAANAITIEPAFSSAPTKRPTSSSVPATSSGPASPSVQ